MDGSIPKVGESASVQPAGPRRERPRRDGEPVFRVQDEEHDRGEGRDEKPSTKGQEPRPVAPREEGEPGSRLDVSG